LFDYQALAPAIVLLILGAMSPGPSLAVVVRNTASGGRYQGLQCALGHGIGLGLYALAIVFGLAAVMRDAPVAFNLVQGSGGLLLLYLGFQSFRAPTPASPHAPSEAPADSTHRSTRGFAEGFVIAVLNPKIAVFFLAVFSSVLHAELTHRTQLAMAVAAWLIDTGWYAFVVAVLSTGPALNLLRSQGRTIDLVMGAIFFVLAVVTLVDVIRFWTTAPSAGTPEIQRHHLPPAQDQPLELIVVRPDHRPDGKTPHQTGGHGDQILAILPAPALGQENV
jgi:threonine/homoserine/homoserine lactone efflux protein